MGASEARIKLTAEDVTAAAFASVVKNVQGLKGELAGLPAKFTQIAIATAGIGSIAGFASMISDTIEARARLKDLSTQTNISVEALSGLAKIGKLTNTPIEDIAAASVKLSKNLFTTTESSRGAGAAVKSLGLDMNQLKTQSPEQQLYSIAKALDGFQDGAGKSAVATLLLGKAGAEMLPFLKELSEQGLQAGRVTALQAEEARKYERDLRTLKAASEEWKKSLADDMLPTLMEFSRELVAGRQAYGSWIGAIVGIGTTNPFNTLGENITTARDDVHSLEEELRKSKSGSLVERALSRPTEVIEGQLDSARRRYDYFKRVQTQQALDLGASTYDDPRFTVRKPVLKAPVEDEALTKAFQGRLKLIKEELERERAGYEFANKYLKGVYDDGLTSLTDYYEKEKALRDANLQSELHAIDAEIAAAQELKSKAIKPEARQEAENKIQEARARRARLNQEATQKDILAAQDEAKAVKQLAFSYYDFLANIATLRGDTEGASALRIAKQVQDAQELLTKIGFSPDEVQTRAGAFKLLLEQTESLKQAQSDYNRLVESLGLTEKGLSLDAQASGASEIDTLRAIGAERQKQLPLLQALVERAVKEAQAIGSPEALLAAQRLQLTLKAAAAEADPLFLRLRDIGKEAGEAIANDAEQAITHWEGFRKLINAVEGDILRIATHKLFTEPFGNFLTNAIGGNGQASGGGGLLGSGFLAKLFNPGASTGGGFGTGSEFGNMDFGGFFASGGTLQPGEWGVAGEHGPEPIYAGATPLSVIPNRAGGASPVNINVTMPPGTTRQTALQAAAMIGDRVQSAMRRNR